MYYPTMERITMSCEIEEDCSYNTMSYSIFVALTSLENHSMEEHDVDLSQKWENEKEEIKRRVEEHDEEEAARLMFEIIDDILEDASVEGTK